MEYVTSDTKEILLQHIQENPGIRYRELLRLTGLTNGVLTYHLSVLERSDRVRVDRKSRVTRFFPLCLSPEESDIMGCLQTDTARRIVVFILEHDFCSFNEIVEHMGKAPSTISWHLKRLREAGIVVARNGEYTLYQVADKETVVNLLSRYKESFLDKVVDSYVEMIEEL